MSWAAAAAGLNVAGGIMGFMGNSKSARSGIAIAEYNAKIQERNAKVFEQDADQKLLINDLQTVRAEQEYSRFLSSAQTNYNNSGVVSTSDTPLLVLLENARQIDEDLATNDYNVKLEALQSREKATGLRMSANVTRAEGAARSQAYQMQAYGSLLGGATRAAGSMRFA
tara:strand:- start:10605 stop:11111 length:507 start_codon:yes stop_codon:yes gene_type:complete